jgi:2-amino-4-hydroxy-6-hydroxymethyldihydropteridine diphosphokinase
VDIIAYGDVVSSDPELTLPHPRAAERAFVLYPWSLIDPAAELNGERVGDLAAKAADFGDLATFDGFQTHGFQTHGAADVTATERTNVSGTAERP